MQHDPVMLAEVLELLAPVSGGMYVDCTVGGGGHAAAILACSSPDGFLLGLDQDAAALERAEKRLTEYGSRFKLVKANFRFLGSVLKTYGIKAVDGFLYDLGVSSFQLDEPERGFTYRYDAPLDMRMDESQQVTAAELVNHLPQEELTRIIKEYGEERWAQQIAQAIVRERKRGPIVTTGQLVEIIKKAIPAPARREGGHPARRTFQALRIAVNDELAALRSSLKQAIEWLRPGGRIVVISFHSLEDRIVKELFREEARTCICPPRQPVCNCHHRARLTILTRRPLLPSAAEVERNPRARSARLRAAARLP